MLVEHPWRALCSCQRSIGDPLTSTLAGSRGNLVAALKNAAANAVSRVAAHPQFDVLSQGLTVGLRAKSRQQSDLTDTCRGNEPRRRTVADMRQASEAHKRWALAVCQWPRQVTNASSGGA